MASNIDRLIEEIKKLSTAEKFELARRLDETGLFDDDQSWFWTPEWQAGEKEADEDIAAGRTIRFNNPEKAIQYYIIQLRNVGMHDQVFRSPY